MIVLDSNVISEPQRRMPHRTALEWLDRQVLDTLFLTRITLADVRCHPWMP